MHAAETGKHSAKGRKGGIGIALSLVVDNNFQKFYTPYTTEHHKADDMHSDYILDLTNVALPHVQTCSACESS